MQKSTFLAFVLVSGFAAASSAPAADVEGLPSAEVLGGNVAQTCLDDLRAFEEQLWRVGFGVLPPGGYGAMPPGYSDFYTFGVQATPREKMQTLRQAAYVHAFDGEEQSCQREFAAMRAVYEEHQQLIGAETDDPDARMTWRRAHLARAKPVEMMDHLMRADVLIGSEIRNIDDERLGEIVDFVLDPADNTILYVLVSRGGFFGLGGKLVAVRWSDLRATEDHELYVLDVPPETMDNAPAVDRTNFPRSASGEWLRSLSQYWETALE